jgi:hypothetical protein
MAKTYLELSISFTWHIKILQWICHTEGHSLGVSDSCMLPVTKGVQFFYYVFRMHTMDSFFVMKSIHSCALRDASVIFTDLARSETYKFFLRNFCRSESQIVDVWLTKVWTVEKVKEKECFFFLLFSAVICLLYFFIYFVSTSFVKLPWL